ncbi:hypothetical protein QTP88_005084 [Uroleucon formosanum]
MYVMSSMDMYSTLFYHLAFVRVISFVVHLILYRFKMNFATTTMGYLYRNIIVDELKCVEYLKSKNLLSNNRLVCSKKNIDGTECGGQLRETTRSKTYSALYSSHQREMCRRTDFHRATASSLHLQSIKYECKVYQSVIITPRCLNSECPKCATIITVQYIIIFFHFHTFSHRSSYTN